MISADLIDTLLSRGAGRAILVVGDVMLDRFVHGEVSRVSAEAPIPVLARGHETAMLGGAGNVARNIGAMGGRPILTGLVGSDAGGSECAKLAEAAGIACGLVVDNSRPTTLKVRFSAAGQQLLRVDTEQAIEASPVVEAALLQTIEQLGAEARAILLSDYGKGAITAKVIAACQALSERTGAPIIVDSKAQKFAPYGRVAVLKPNSQELSRATNLPTESDEEVVAAAQAALATCAAERLLVTRAAKGLSLAQRDGAVLHLALPPPEVFDTAGAGDTALAALGMAMASGAPADIASRLALLASWKVVQKAGVAAVTASELVTAALEVSGKVRAPKIASYEAAAEAAAGWRQQSLRVGFTNGCFDLLHPGHVACLTQARSWCDRLIVGLNSDDSVRRAKGPTRPINPARARAEVLAALEAVDLVVEFSDDTPIELIRAIRPDLLVKGADYSRETIVGADLVEGWGGEVRLADLAPGHSTSRVVERLGNRS